MVEFEVEYNASVHNTTTHTPFFFNYDAHPRIIPPELMVLQSHPSVKELLSMITKSSALVRANIVKKNIEMAKYANLKRTDHSFRVGDRVLLSTKSLKL